VSIFPVIETDHVVQVNDKFRISAVKSYVAKGQEPISDVEIEPFDGHGFVSVFSPRGSDWFLDWQYDTEGEKQITLRITSGSDTPVTQEVTAVVECLTAEQDHLLSADQDLVAIESKILSWVPAGRNSFLYAHREAQRQILEWLWTNGFKKSNGSKVEKSDLLDIEEFRFWSRFVTLRLIFNDISNSVDDIFDKKAKAYKNEEFLWRNKASLKLDWNGDGNLEDLEFVDMTVRSLVRT